LASTLGGLPSYSPVNCWTAFSTVTIRSLREHGIERDNTSTREQFERRMERRVAQESNGAAWKPLEQGSYLGSEQIRAKLLERIEPQLGEHHSGRLLQKNAEAKAQRMNAQELKRLRWKEGDLKEKAKRTPGKLALPARLRREQPLPSGKSCSACAWRVGNV